jgi:hypothetical protein
MTNDEPQQMPEGSTLPGEREESEEELRVKEKVEELTPVVAHLRARGRRRSKKNREDSPAWQFSQEYKRKERDEIPAADLVGKTGVWLQLLEVEESDE